jgi:hypothetical protein
VAPWFARAVSQLVVQDSPPFTLEELAELTSGSPWKLFSNHAKDEVKATVRRLFTEFRSDFMPGVFEATGNQFVIRQYQLRDRNRQLKPFFNARCNQFVARKDAIAQKELSRHWLE